jgi:hypothetical protein
MELLSRLLPQGAPLHLETWHLNEVAAQLTLRVTSRRTSSSRRTIFSGEGWASLRSTL